METSTWKNLSADNYNEKFGPNAFEDKRNKAVKEGNAAVHHGTSATEKFKLSLVSSKVKKLVDRPLLRRHHAVGAVGYAVVCNDERLPENEFFQPGRKFRIRFRHSNVGCDNDAMSCQREAAIKFADQNTEGPLDLILLTGRTSLARNSQTLIKVMKLSHASEVEKMCNMDPLFYYSLVDALRRNPSSFADQTYYSQMAYQFVCKDGRQMAVHFRLLPVTQDGCCHVESGQLDASEQKKPWQTMCFNGVAQCKDDDRPTDYLRREFIARLQRDEPVSYQLQIQMNTSTDPIVWNPQQLWDETQYPWINLARIQLTTFVPCRALRRTYFNIIEKPSCLRFPAASSATDPHSLQHSWSTIYTEFEMNKHICQIGENDSANNDVSQRPSCSTNRKHIVTLCMAPVKTGGTVPRVDVYITFAGTQCRSTPQLLSDRVDLPTVSWLDQQSRFTEHFEINIDEDFGQLLSVILSIKHRSLTEQWYLEQVFVVSNHRTHNQTVQCFPCHNIVLSRVALLAGEACTAEKQLYELHRQEREFELSERRQQYQWANNNHSGQDQPLPRQIKATSIKDLPDLDALRAAKFTGLRWDIDPVLIEFFRYIQYDVLTNERATKSSNGGQVTQATDNFRPKLETQMSLEPATGNSFNATTAAARRKTLLRHFSVQNDYSDFEPQRSVPVTKAQQNWKKVKNAVQFMTRVRCLHLPEGAKGDMCRAVQNDEEFGRWFLSGPNPNMIRRCTDIPTDRLPVTDQMMAGLLDRTGKLADEARNGYVYIVDYKLLDNIPTVHRDADHRYIAAPIVLLYVRPNGNLVPLVIQLKQTPGPDNPIWTRHDCPENWILAKLWVQHADFEWHFAIAHLFRCHWLMEPFVVATMRQLGSAHPVFKLLKPHFRYTLVTNMLIRNNVLQRSGHVDRFHSLGLDGVNALISLYWSSNQFSFDDLDPSHDLQHRGVADKRLLPHYIYRDDAIKLWTLIRDCVTQILTLFYSNDTEVTSDSELQTWLKELREVGFHGNESVSRFLTATSCDQLCALVSRIIFTLTGQHAATHFDALDLYGFLPDIPAMMRRPPPSRKDFHVTRDELSATLPDQFPDAYFVALAFVIQVHQPDENLVGNSTEVYFVEPEVHQVLSEFRQALNQLAKDIKLRHLANNARFELYESLSPAFIPVSAEPVPYIPHTAVKQALLHGPKLSRDVFVKMMAGKAMAVVPSVDLMTLPVCLHFVQTLGARSFIGRRLAAENNTVGSSVWPTGRIRIESDGVVSALQSNTAGRQRRLESSAF